MIYRISYCVEEMTYSEERTMCVSAIYDTSNHFDGWLCGGTRTEIIICKSIKNRDKKIRLNPTRWPGTKMEMSRCLKHLKVGAG